MTGKYRQPRSLTLGIHRMAGFLLPSIQAGFSAQVQKIFQTMSLA